MLQIDTVSLWVQKRGGGSILFGFSVPFLNSLFHAAPCEHTQAPGVQCPGTIHHKNGGTGGTCGGGGFCVPVLTGQNPFPGAPGAQIGCPSLFTVGVGRGVLNGAGGGSGPTRSTPSASAICGRGHERAVGARGDAAGPTPARQRVDGGHTSARRGRTTARSRTPRPPRSAPRAPFGGPPPPSRCGAWGSPGAWPSTGSGSGSSPPRTGTRHFHASPCPWRASVRRDVKARAM